MVSAFNSMNMETHPDDLAALADLVRHQVHLSQPSDFIRVVEIGSWAGRTALTMANVNERVAVHCIDTWLGSPTDMTSKWAAQIGQRLCFETFAKNMGELFLTRIMPHIGTSELWASLWPWQADLVFIDGDHAYESVLADIKAWTPHVRKGGILCGHDFGDQFPGVARAVADTGGCDRVSGIAVWVRVIH